MKKSIKEKIKKIISSLKKEASVTGTMGVATGGVQVGGDAVSTPFAFSKKGARPDTIKQGGYSLAKNSKIKEENQAYGTPAVNIEPEDTYKDKNGLVQHNNPELDPNLIGFKQGRLPVGERKLKKEGYNGLKYEQTADPVSKTQQPVTQPQQSAKPVTVSTYDVLPDFTNFDTKLKGSTESLKNNLQKNIQDKILGKKIVIRASKGYKQPEADYTVNVTGVSIDYYYDRYVIIILGREENKQKIAKFFIKPGFKIKVLGNAENLKPKDQYQVAKSKALTGTQDIQQNAPTNVVTSDTEDNIPAPAAKQQSPQGQ